MKSKKDCHESLSLLFKRDGVPPKMVTDGAKEETQGKFAVKCREADCHLVQTEPYSPWQLSAEGTIKELKKHSSWQMKGSPKKLWDNSLELCALVCSHTAHDIYMLEGEVHETLMSGQTADISNICEHEWYDWVLFRDGLLSYPESPLVLGRYLGPAADVGSAMAYKILKESGEIVIRTTVRSLTPDEADSPVMASRQKAFTDRIDIALGPGATVDDFDLPDLTPEFEYYEDDDEIFEGTADELPPTPELLDNYVNVQIELPRGDGSEMVGRVTK